MPSSLVVWHLHSLPFLFNSLIPGPLGLFPKGFRICIPVVVTVSCMVSRGGVLCNPVGLCYFHQLPEAHGPQEGWGCFQGSVTAQGWQCSLTPDTLFLFYDRALFPRKGSWIVCVWGGLPWSLWGPEYGCHR